MGAWLCKRETNHRVTFLGLDAAGKTSLLYRLKLGKVITTIPSIGFNVETVSIRGLTITGWDLGGRCAMRPLYRHYNVNVSGIVYVIDSNDRERLDEALDELVKFVLLEEPCNGAVVMVMANKQDLDKAVTAQEIEDCLKDKTSKLDLKNLIFVMPCSVTSGDGVWEAFDSFCSQIQHREGHETKRGIVSLSELERDQSVDNNKENKFSPASLMKNSMHFLKSLLFY